MKNTELITGMRIILCQMNKFVSDICPTSKTVKAVTF